MHRQSVTPLSMFFVYLLLAVALNGQAEDLRPPVGDPYTALIFLRWNAETLNEITSRSEAMNDPAAADRLARVHAQKIGVSPEGLAILAAAYGELKTKLDPVQAEAVAYIKETSAKKSPPNTDRLKAFDQMRRQLILEAMTRLRSGLGGDWKAFQAYLDGDFRNHVQRSRVK